MLILGITTSTQQVGCAIGGHEGVLASVHSSRGKRHAETLTPAIEFITRQARVDLSEISAVAIDVGPGLFTGLRVGVASAKAIAFALRVPMVGVVSLDLLAFAVRHSPRAIHAVLDARRGEVFTAAYRQVPGGVQRLAEPSVCSPDDLASDLVAADEECLLVGDGAIRHRELFDQVRRVDIGEHSLANPSAGALVQLAHAKALREDFVNTWDVEPLYLRLPDAEINWEQRSRT
ncbi:MAG TPA: tRNA (adenosine(37)-N6)-threonylcarbamoyltransferase complex dimerization subunit type 1 TsaB [Acidimicrobiales bacterium]|nr:tRNA (adenosine(37)-N6)-threonylcarbamoyltransferase complex dimerization subunit type 1 TsaB [Acidimicrobiales bacterium]